MFRLPEQRLISREVVDVLCVGKEGVIDRTVDVAKGEDQADLNVLHGVDMAQLPQLDVPPEEPVGEHQGCEGEVEQA